MTVRDCPMRYARSSACQWSRHPVQVVEDDLRRRRQIVSDAAGDDVGQEDANALVPLEAIDQRLASVDRRSPRQQHRRAAKVFASVRIGSSKQGR